MPAGSHFCSERGSGGGTAALRLGRPQPAWTSRRRGGGIIWAGWSGTSAARRRAVHSGTHRRGRRIQNRPLGRCHCCRHTKAWPNADTVSLSRNVRTRERVIALFFLFFFEKRQFSLAESFWHGSPSPCVLAGTLRMGPSCAISAYMYLFYWRDSLCIFLCP